MSLSLDLYWLELYQAARPWLNKAAEHMQTPYAWLELFSAVCALLGSLLLALKGRRAGWGWVLFAFSNAGWIVFANGYGHWFFLLQQIGFSITSAIGIWQYLVKVPQPQPFATFTAFSEAGGTVDIAARRVTHLTSHLFHRTGGRPDILVTEVHLDNATSILVVEDQAIAKARLCSAGWQS
ncbi:MULTISPECIES: hypothetical protein [unclassified Polaromonas]|jgi:hypothetical protein|uniref:hypothetical protein n=1 Tax=unclassified Polaromonas TaxID=2638319 RepID=UPI000BCBA1F9|nr:MULTISPECIES: hypothetical protein [unclassified Polaromonas]OYY32692.1 MAG: hypothetical protein B7Y60_21540 [Polaromonas sp. 35-63-35]OYZ16133.1 MAG: hypothetical protein B7Y28_21330 [Polaromonas sp. 16-63-31]OYZ75988.1 MAG: hypothetical protein B7Y09_22315 [Polaromonas sp. 24-63-21]OZA52967.1 MAG: hypothetical protein B7X88_03455 [Polaromonas sp. 17-63-33]OZA85427.1 MAG: hypothetical protein B7X65_21465 [Polaromonas sp. 39-63-25]